MGREKRICSSSEPPSSIVLHDWVGQQEKIWSTYNLGIWWPGYIIRGACMGKGLRKENEKSWESHTWTGGKGPKYRYHSAHQDLPLGPRLSTPWMAGLAADGSVASHFPGTVLGHRFRAVTLPPWLWRYTSCTILPIWGNLEWMFQSPSLLGTQLRPFWWLYRGANSKSVHFRHPLSLLQVSGSQFSLQ